MKKLIHAVALLSYTIAFGQSNNGNLQRCHFFEANREVRSPLSCNKGPNVLIFEDDFSNNEIDTNIWDVYQGVPRDLNFHSQKAYHTLNNIKIENGCLEIITKKENLYNIPYVINWSTMDTSYTDFEYTTGEVFTKSLFSINTTIEARIKLPKERGLWPAFWIYSEESGNYNEIDIFEAYTIDKELTTTAHYKKNYHSGQNVNRCCYTPENINFKDLTENFHIYKLVWKDDRIEWYIDNKLIRRIPYYYEKRRYLLFFRKHYPVYCNDVIVGNKYRRLKYFPENPMKIILNTAVEVAPRKPNAAFISDTMFIDYVKVYKPMKCFTNVNINNLPNLDYTTLGQHKNLYTLITGYNVNVSCNMSIHSNHSVSVIANHDIYINAPSEIETDGKSYFFADTKTCNNNKDIYIENISDLTRIEEEDTTYDYLECFDSIYEENDIYLTDELDSIGILLHNANVEISLIDSSSHILFNDTANTTGDIYINISNYNAGIYFLFITNNLLGIEEKYRITIIK